MIWKVETIWEKICMLLAPMRIKLFLLERPKILLRLPQAHKQIGRI
jgi:hypothetical protein